MYDDTSSINLFILFSRADSSSTVILPNPAPFPASAPSDRLDKSSTSGALALPDKLTSSNAWLKLPLLISISYIDSVILSYTSVWFLTAELTTGVTNTQAIMATIMDASETAILIIPFLYPCQALTNSITITAINIQFICISPIICS